ncbi:hypothetical protein [Acrocarpospora macrocephala]|nr:hypothetical protein [Acrocarpospora macrocephala]
MIWSPHALPDLSGRTFALTGGNAGIGCFIAEETVDHRSAERAR